MKFKVQAPASAATRTPQGRGSASAGPSKRKVRQSAAPVARKQSKSDSPNVSLYQDESDRDDVVEIIREHHICLTLRSLSDHNFTS